MALFQKGLKTWLPNHHQINSRITPIRLLQNLYLRKHLPEAMYVCVLVPLSTLNTLTIVG